MIQVENPVHKKVALSVDFIFRIIFYIGRFCGLWYVNKNSLLQIKPSKILIIEEEPLGDVIMSTAILLPLRKKYPEAHIALMVGSWAKEILLNNPDIDEVIINDCPWAFSDLIIGKKGFLGHIRYFITYPNFLVKLIMKKFDLAIDLKGDFRNILFFMFMPRIKYTLSYSRSGGDYFLSESVKFNKEEHEIDKNFSLLKSLGVNTDDRKISLYPAEADFKFINEILNKFGVDEKDFLCVIHAGVGRKVRLWPLERYSAVGDFVNKEYNAKVILTGTIKDLEITNIIQQNMKHKSINLSGKITLLQLTALLKRTNLLLCPDTSILHLAWSVSTPIVALFGPANPKQTGYFGDNMSVVDKNLFCRPCIQKKCDNMINYYSACMYEITVEDVKTGIRNLLSKRLN